MYAFKEDRDRELRLWAKGSLPDMAAAELLIRSGWAERMDKSGWIRNDGGYAYPRVGDYLSLGHWSGGERRQLSIIASLMAQSLDADDDEAESVKVDLSYVFGNVDSSFIRLFQIAVGIPGGLYETWPGESDG